jgi:hypothetical protein
VKGGCGTGLAIIASGWLRMAVTYGEAAWQARVAARWLATWILDSYAPRRAPRDLDRLRDAPRVQERTGG